MVSRNFRATRSSALSQLARLLPIIGCSRRPVRPTVSPRCVPLEQRRPALAGCARSEEHTSELQSLMRISYAVFCLKKKKHHIKEPHRLQHLTHLSLSDEHNSLKQ